jgi:hypothetical protein
MQAFSSNENIEKFEDILNGKLFRVQIKKQTDEVALLDLIEKLKESSGANYISPVLLNREGQVIGGLNDRLG